MKILKENKKGFTLVELLAVIVILALIMSVAVVSMGSVMETARKKTFKETAAAIIDGVRNQLTISNKLYDDTVTGLSFKNDGAIFYFGKTLLDQGATESPMGGSIEYFSGDVTNKYGDIGASSAADVTTIGGKLYYVSGQTRGTGTGKVACTNSKTQPSFVTVKKNSTTGEFTYTICLMAGQGNYYINDATYDELMTDAADAKITQTA